VEEQFVDQIRIGLRVEVQFGKKRRYSGIIHSIHDSYDGLVRAKPVLAVLDDEPIIHKQQLELWEWGHASLVTIQLETSKRI
jgi:primosomal protein N' (replication factor Y)